MMRPKRRLHESGSPAVLHAYWKEPPDPYLHPQRIVFEALWQARRDGAKLEGDTYN